METTEVEDTARSAQPMEGEPLGFSDPAQDPEHDIDAKKTFLWLIFWTLAIFICMWLLLQLFLFVVGHERFQKINLVQPATLIDLRSHEETELNERVDLPGNRQRIPIGEAMERYVKQGGKLYPRPNTGNGTPTGNGAPKGNGK